MGRERGKVSIGVEGEWYSVDEYEAFEEEAGEDSIWLFDMATTYPSAPATAPPSLSSSSAHPPSSPAAAASASANKLSARYSRKALRAVATVVVHAETLM